MVTLATREFTLPCGWQAPDGKIYTQVAIKEITGTEEDIFSNHKLEIWRRMLSVCSNCVVKLGPLTDPEKIREAVLDLPIGDLMFIMVSIRRASLGDLYRFSVECPVCAEKNKDDKEKKEKARFFAALDLSKLEVQVMKRPDLRRVEIDLPSGSVAVFRVMTGQDYERVAKESDVEDQASTRIFARIETLDGKVPDMETIKKMPTRDRNTIRTLIEATEGGVETSIELVHDTTDGGCGQEIRSELDIGQPDFFFPRDSGVLDGVRSLPLTR